MAETGPQTDLSADKAVASEAHEVTFCDGRYMLASFEPKWSTAECPQHGEMYEVELQATRDGDVWVLDDEHSFWLCLECLGALMDVEENFQDDPDPVEFLGEFTGHNWSICEQYMTPVTSDDVGGDRP